eukprot:gb/GECH01013451.1/.p1 GENE.gb/GECH01013451.1/~~gb/GECH01013451.1/.p1  ORF type:complete len:138 (+),score=47.06 gb/GECH01013451.1/:1-414(+)
MNKNKTQRNIKNKSDIPHHKTYVISDIEFPEMEKERKNEERQPLLASEHIGHGKKTYETYEQKGEKLYQSDSSVNQENHAQKQSEHFVSHSGGSNTKHQFNKLFNDSLGENKGEYLNLDQQGENENDKEDDSAYEHK